MGNNQKIKFIERIYQLDQENLAAEAWSYEAWVSFFQKAKVHYCSLSDEIIEEVEISKMQDEPKACYMLMAEEDVKIALANATKTEEAQNQEEIYIFSKGESQEVLAIIATSIIDDFIELLKIFVIKTERKKGLGKKILNFWLTRQNKINYEKVILEHRAVTSWQKDYT